MAFITAGTTFYSYAEYQDVLDMDMRLFEANEGINVVDDIEDLLIKSSNRINSLLSNTLDITIDPFKVLGRQADFTDLCVYHTLYEYLLPKVADFGEDDNAERVKIDFYQNKFSILYDELIKDGGWYDYNADSTVDQNEYASNYQRLRRVR